MYTSRKVFGILFLALFCSISVTAQVDPPQTTNETEIPPPPPVIEAEETTEDSPTLFQETQRDDYALLWEVTGNGLTEPSYLFGSMHVRYKSVFEFPDSMLICLQNCTAIANEIHLDSAMQRIYEVRLGQQELDVDSTYKAVTAERSALTDSLNKAFVEQNDMDPADIRDFLKGVKQYSDLEERGEMRTMLDAYLMDIARNMGLRQYGLEVIDHHLYQPNVDFIPPTPLKMFVYMSASNSLIDMYYEGDIYAMDTLIRSSPEFYEQVSLIPRNYIMVESIMRIMHEEGERLFAVVGSAHLPGPEGVIDLLRDQGYTLRRVTPEFTGLRDSIAITDQPRPWGTIEADRGAFEYGLPFPQFAYEYTVGMTETTYCFDIGRGLTYTVTQMPLTVTEEANISGLLFTDEGATVAEKDTCVINGQTGTRYVLEQYSEMEHAVAYVFEQDNELYVLKVEAYLEEELENPDVEEFINRFQLNSLRNNKWTTVTDEQGGFQVKVPTHYTYTFVRESDSYYGYDPHSNYPYAVYRANFADPAAAVRMSYFDYEPEGRPTPTDDRLQSAVDFVGNQWGMSLEVTEKDSTGQFPVWSFEGESYYDASLVLRGKSMLRGNRIYLLEQVDSKRQLYTKKFLPSFSLLESPTAPYDYHSMAEEAVSFYLPEEANESEVDEYQLAEGMPQEAAYRTTILDPHTGASFFVDVYEAPTLYGIADSTRFFDEALSIFINEEYDSLLQSSTILVDDKFPGREMRYHLSDRNIELKVQTYTAGNYWVRKRLYALPETIAGPQAQRFFEEDQWQDTIQSPLLLGNKSTQLFAQLGSADTLLLDKALQAFSPKTSVGATDISAMMKLLKNQDHWAGWNNRLQMQANLVEAVSEQEATGLAALEELFLTEMNDDTLQAAILNQLGRYTIDSMATYFRLLTERPMIADHGFLQDYHLNAAIGTEETFEQHWPQLQNILENGKVPERIWKLFADGITSQVIDSTFFQSYQSEVLAAGQQSLGGAANRTLVEQVMRVYRTLDINAPSLVAQANDFLAQSTPDFRSVAGAEILLRANQKLPKKTIKNILRKRQLRGAMLRVLNDSDQLQLGKSYFDQQLIASDMLRERFFTDEVEDVSQIIHRGVIEVLHEGEPYLVHLFTFTTEEVDNRLAIVGFFDKEAETPEAFIDADWVRYTYSPVGKSQWEERGKRLANQMSKGYGDYDFDFNF